MAVVQTTLVYRAVHDMMSAAVCWEDERAGVSGLMALRVFSPGRLSTLPRRSKRTRSPIQVEVPLSAFPRRRVSKSLPRSPTPETRPSQVGRARDVVHAALPLRRGLGLSFRDLSSGRRIPSRLGRRFSRAVTGGISRCRGARRPTEMARRRHAHHTRLGRANGDSVSLDIHDMH